VQHVQAPPYLNLTKRYANWNACYSCGFDVPAGHTSQTCRHPFHQAECVAVHQSRVQLRN
jgi:hypothetical protein